MTTFPIDSIAPPPETEIFLPGVRKALKARSLSVADSDAIEDACMRPLPCRRDDSGEPDAEDAARFTREQSAFHARCDLVTVAVACGMPVRGTKLDGTEPLRFDDEGLAGVGGDVGGGAKVGEGEGTVGTGSARDQNRVRYAKAVAEQLGVKVSRAWVYSAMSEIASAGGFDSAIKDSSAPIEPDPAAE